MSVLQPPWHLATERARLIEMPGALFHFSFDSQDCPCPAATHLSPDIQPQKEVYHQAEPHKTSPHIGMRLP
jgi:hypothetical protein